jgi:hypothetical protein
MNRLEPLLKSGQRITLVMEPAGEDKVRVTYINWDGERIILAEQSVEVWRSTRRFTYSGRRGVRSTSTSTRPG